MKITFIKDHLSILSGNSFYKAGTQADLMRGKQLIEAGIARVGWSIEDAQPNQFNPDYSGVDVFADAPIEELRGYAKLRGIKGYARMKRKTLIKRLESGN